MWRRTDDLFFSSQRPFAGPNLLTTFTMDRLKHAKIDRAYLCDKRKERDMASTPRILGVDDEAGILRHGRNLTLNVTM